MIEEIIIKPEPKYGKYFLSFEAPEDEGSTKENTKVINVKPNNRRLDFSNGAEESPEDNNEETDNEQSEVNTDDDGPDISDDTDFNNDEEENQSSDTNNNEETDNEQSEVNTDDDGPDISDDTDFSDSNNNESENNSSDSNSSNDEDNNKDNGPGLDYDSTRKYILFKNYRSLINALNNYIKKLENNIGDDLNINKIIKTGINKLKEISELCIDYIIMKFEVSTYIQSLLFYQNAIVMVQSAFDVLSYVKDYNKNKNEE